MSEQYDQTNPEALRRVRLFAEAYRQGGSQRALAADEDHEENVRKYWRHALTACLERDVGTASAARTARVHEISDPMRCEAIRFLAAHFDWPLDRMLSEISRCDERAVQAAKNGNAQGIWIFAILMIMAAAAGAARLRPELLPVLLMAGVLSVLGFFLLTSRSSRLRRTVRQDGYSVKTMEDCCDICAAGAFQNMNRGALAFCAALLIGAGGYTYYRHLPLPMDQQVVKTVHGYNSTVPTEALDQLLLKDGKLTEDRVQAIGRAFGLFPESGEHPLQLAVYVNQRVEAGYPEKTAREKLNAELALLDLKTFSTESNRGLLRDMVRKVPWSGEALYQRWLATGRKDDADMAAVVGEGLKTLEYEKKLDCAKQAQRAGLPYAAMMGSALTGMEINELRERIGSETDPEVLAVLAGIYGRIADTPEAVVPLLYRLRTAGISLKEVFPEGIRVTMDLEPLNYQHMKDGKGAGTIPAVEKFLVLSRAEHDEPMEWLIRKPREDYDSHDKTKTENFDVNIVTGGMDLVPEERFPATYDECTVLIVADMSFVPGGCYEWPLSSGQSSGHSIYTPVYARLYRVMAVQKDGTLPIAALYQKLVENEKLDKYALSYEADIQIMRKYLAKQDRSWLADRLARCMVRYAQADWYTMAVLMQQDPEGQT